MDQAGREKKKRRISTWLLQYDWPMSILRSGFSWCEWEWEPVDARSTVSEVPVGAFFLLILPYSEEVVRYVDST